MEIWLVEFQKVRSRIEVSANSLERKTENGAFLAPQKQLPGEVSLQDQHTEAEAAVIQGESAPVPKLAANVASSMC